MENGLLQGAMEVHRTPWPSLVKKIVVWNCCYNLHDLHPMHFSMLAKPPWFTPEQCLEESLRLQLGLQLRLPQRLEVQSKLQAAPGFVQALKAVHLARVQGLAVGGLPCSQEVQARAGLAPRASSRLITYSPRQNKTSAGITCKAN
jgi:hypothetical protein